jgi:uncharacterized protein (TIGR02186 family)
LRVLARIAGLACLSAGGLWSASAGAEPLLADISPHRIAITAEFKGAPVLVYGVIDEPGDVIVVVRGPTDSVTVRRKGRFAGIWLNRESVRFADVPAYYAVSASRPLAEVLGDSVRRQQQIGIDTLEIATAEDDIPDLDAFRAALVQRRQDAGLYSREPGRVRFLGARPQLFKATFFFPASISAGSYRIDILLVRDGAIVKAQTMSLSLSQEGRVADITLFARNQAPAYGLIAIALSLLAGWAAHLAFRRL